MLLRQVMKLKLVIDGFSNGLDKLQLGAVSFTDEQLIQNHALFDITSVTSFRVQCSKNCYGLNCTTFCEPEEGVYTCDNEGSLVPRPSRSHANIYARLFLITLKSGKVW